MNIEQPSLKFNDRLTQPSAMRKALEELSKQPISEGGLINSSLSEESLCLFLSILMQYFSQAKLRLELRYFILALIAASGDRKRDASGWFELRDYELARLLIDDETLTKGALKKRIKRLRDSLEEWQIKNQVIMVVIDRGYGEYQRDKEGKLILRPDGEKATRCQPSRYSLPILHKAFQLFRQMQSPFNPTPKELKDISRALAEEVRGLYYPIDSAGRKVPERQRSRLRSRALNALKRFMELARQENDDPITYLLELLREAEKYVGPDDRIEMYRREQLISPEEKFPGGEEWFDEVYKNRKQDLEQKVA